MIGRLVWGAMDPARPIEYSVQTGWTIFVSFEWLLPLTGFRATESGVHRCIFSIFVVASMLVFVASWLTVAISGFGGARVAGVVPSTSEPAVFSRAKAGQKCGKGCHGLRFLLAEVSGKPLVSDTMFEGREGFGIRKIHNLILFN